MKLARQRLVHVALSAAVALLVAHSGAAASDPGDNKKFNPAIATLADDLERDYVFADVGRQYADYLRKRLAKNAYAGITDPDEISRRLTEELRALHPDLHLRVRPIGQPAAGGGNTQPTIPPIEGPAWLADGVATIRFHSFPGTPETIAATQKFMREFAGAKVLIIDSRHNHGGGADEMNVMLPYLFAVRTRVADMELSGDVAKEQGFVEDKFFHRVAASPGKVRFEQIVEPAPVEHRLFNAKVFYLTSLDTGSAAEALAFIFKNTHRATIVGERTRGMDHFGKFVSIGEGLECFVPMGRTFDPETGADWEGGGVLPDIAVSPDEALQTAMKLAQQ